MINDFKTIIKKRIAIHPEYDYGIEQCWKEELLLVKENPDEALHFINEEATDIEVYWFSEVLCEIYDATLDSRFIKAFENRANHMNDAEMKRSILQEINHV